MPDGQSTRILAVGNGYVPAEILVDGLMRHGRPAGLSLDTRTVSLPYPPAEPAPLPEVDDDRIRGYWESNEAIVARLDDDEADTTLREYIGPVDGLVDEMGDASIVLCHNAPLSRNAIEAAPELRIVGSIRTIPGNINLDALNRRRIPLFTTPSRNARSVAELIIGGLLAHMRGIVTSASQLHAGHWSFDAWRWESAGSQLGGKVCGLVGFGKVGAVFASIAKGFGLDLLVHDPYADPDEIEDRTGRAPVDLDMILSSADVIVMCARLNQDNVHMIDEAAFHKMKPSAILVNTARARLIDYAAMRTALVEGRLAGAVLDVYDPEPPLAGDELLHMPNTLLTPHIAGACRETVEHGADMLGRVIVDHLVQGSYENCHNREAVETS